MGDTDSAFKICLVSDLIFKIKITYIVWLSKEIGSKYKIGGNRCIK